MTRTEAEATAREILGHSEYEFSNEKHDCGHCGAVAAALLAAAAEEREIKCPHCHTEQKVVVCRNCDTRFNL